FVCVCVCRLVCVCVCRLVCVCVCRLVCVCVCRLVCVCVCRSVCVCVCRLVSRLCLPLGFAFVFAAWLAVCVSVGNFTFSNTNQKLPFAFISVFKNQTSDSLFSAPLFN
ncbi:MAG: hypothetical protein RBQ94_05465, partial [Methanimicrococcus sp.]|nr:hypothetical protein [Methanimicrococcus sp.]